MSYSPFEAWIPMTEYEGASPEVKKGYDDQIAAHGRITNMKRTLLHDVPSFNTYMEWYDMQAAIVPWLGQRPFILFSYAISSGNDCLICSTFFRKIMIDSGDDPDDPKLSEEEKLLMDFGRYITKDPHNIPDGIYDELKKRWNDKQLVQLIAFAGIMYATNLFNTVAKVPLDEVLYGYTKKGDNDAAGK